MACRLLGVSALVGSQQVVGATGEDPREVTPLAVRAFVHGHEFQHCLRGVLLWVTRCHRPDVVGALRGGLYRRRGLIVTGGRAILIGCVRKRWLTRTERIVCRIEAWKTPALPVEACVGLVVAMLVVVVNSTRVGVAAIEVLAVVVVLGQLQESAECVTPVVGVVWPLLIPLLQGWAIALVGEAVAAGARGARPLD